MFIGPRPDTIRLMGDKISALRAMQEAGVPCVPGSGGPVDEESPEETQRLARDIGYPVIIKAAGGGGGRGDAKCDLAAVGDDDLVEHGLQRASAGRRAARARAGGMG